MRDRYRGCLLGGAVGDALGSGIELLSLAEIRHRYGPAGVTAYVPAYARAGDITDDTQMTLFTAEGLLRDQQAPPSVRNAPAAIWRAYQRWLNTQYREPAVGGGWLSSQEFLRHERARTSPEDNETGNLQDICTVSLRLHFLSYGCTSVARRSVSLRFRRSQARARKDSAVGHPKQSRRWVSDTEE